MVQREADEVISRTGLASTFGRIPCNGENRVALAVSVVRDDREDRPDQTLVQ